MTYHLLDHVNRLNAAELAKPRDARTNMTPGWAPPSEVVFATKPVDGFVRANMARPFPRTHSLGRGDKIRCGMPLLPGQHIHTRQLDSKHYNVCRPFDETQAAGDEIEVWLPIPRVLPTNMPPDANAPETVRFELSKRYCCRPSIGFSESDRELYGQSFGKADEQFFKSGALTESAVRLSSEAIRLSAEIDAWHQISAVRFRCVLPKSVERHTPPNHGHGAKCGCGVNRLLPENATIRMDNPKFESVADAYGQSFVRAATGPRCMVVIPRCAPFLLQPDANGKFVTRDADGRVFAANWPDDDCPHCAGTGRIICDQDSLGGQREGRVSPSHKAGGYAEWQRRYANLVWGQIEGNRTFQVPLELAHIYATDGEPATTERE